MRIRNEIITSAKYSNAAHLVQAVFYLETHDKEEDREARIQAQNLAIVLGQKPVLTMDPSHEVGIFFTVRKNSGEMDTSS